MKKTIALLFASCLITGLLAAEKGYKVTIKLTAHPVNENAERHVSEIAVAPLFAGSKFKWDRRYALQQLVFRVIPAQIKFLRVSGKSCCVGE